MRSDLPAAVAAAIERCDEPTLIFDVARIEQNLARFASAARAANVTVLFAAKSFAHPAVWELAARALDGFDVASPGELAALPRAGIVSIADPSGRTVAPDHGRCIVGCETVAQVRRAPAHAEIAIRLSASLTGRDPAIGAVQSGDGHHRSRFGLDVDPARCARAIGELVAAADGRPVGLHVHHGPVSATTGERFAATARAALAIAGAAGLAPRFVNAGGAWHAVADVPRALAELRAAIPADVEPIVEPGRLFVDGAGFAAGRIAVARALDDRALRVAELSRICHLRWSPVELVGTPPPPGYGRPMLVVGPTCFEDDILGEWITLPEAWPTGAVIALRGVTGYAVGWNTGFGGIPPARVLLV